tara:strand:+ start:3893 stop:4339 length:447 start_codon:yes stop_codon:yes gene_type:complete
MNKKELKKVLKPMIKECIHEILLGEGILSGIISEVAKGLGTDLNERQAPRQQTQTKPKSVNETFRNRMRETRPKNNTNEAKRNLMEAINKDAYGGVDLFEGTEPLRHSGSPNSETSGQGALSGVDPNDAGIDISGILSVANRDWSKMI